MTVNLKNLTLETGGKSYLLEPCVSYDELYNLRENSKKHYVVVKVHDCIYTATITGNTNFSGKSTICIICEQFHCCPKVIDKEFITDYKKDYDSLMRLEKYPFITYGVETYSRFFVWKCTGFKLKKSKKQKSEPQDINDVVESFKRNFPNSILSFNYFS